MAWPAVVAAIGAGVGAVGQMGGGLSKMYGAYKGTQMAEKQFEEDKKRYDDQLDRMRMLDQISNKQMNLGNQGEFHQLASNQQDRVGEKYGQYNAQIGK